MIGEWVSARVSPWVTQTGMKFMRLCIMLNYIWKWHVGILFQLYTARSRLAVCIFPRSAIDRRRRKRKMDVCGRDTRDRELRVNFLISIIFKRASERGNPSRATGCMLTHIIRHQNGAALWIFNKVYVVPKFIHRWGRFVTHLLWRHNYNQKTFAIQPLRHSLKVFSTWNWKEMYKDKYNL